MHSLTTPARVLIGVLLAIGLLATSTSSALARSTDDEASKRVPGTAEHAGRVASGYGCNTSAQSLRCYGAIYYSAARDAVGYSTDYSTSTYANRRAYRECSRYSSSCRRVITVRNACAALAVLYWSSGAVRRYDWGYSEKSQWVAVRRAKAKVGTGAKTRTYLCTTRYS